MFPYNLMIFRLCVESLLSVVLDLIKMPRAIQQW